MSVLEFVGPVQGTVRPMQRVMISSSSMDLAAYRRAAIQVCNRLGLQPIAMEYFEATESGATAASLRKVEESDVYVGIFAYRAGYTEPGYDRPLTELEFDHAGDRG